jgi:hypothetical protein
VANHGTFQGFYEKFLPSEEGMQIYRQKPSWKIVAGIAGRLEVECCGHILLNSWSNMMWQHW